MEKGTTILFGLPGVAVERVERVTGEHGEPGRLVHLTTAATVAAGCPACGVISTSVNQFRTTRPRDLPYGDEPLAVVWHKRQYRCREVGCSRKAFTESIAELPPGARLTGRLCRKAAAEVASGRSVSAVAAEYQVSWPVIHRHYAARADQLLTEPDPPVVLGIDETRRGAPRWLQDAETGRWVRTERFETNFTDASGTGRLLGQVAGRTGKTVTGWLDARGQDWKDRSGSWPSTRARSTGPPSSGRCRTRSSSWTTSTSCAWPTRPSPRCGSGSPGRSWAGAAPPATRRGPTGGGCCAPESASPASSSTGCGRRSPRRRRPANCSPPGSQEELRYLLSLARTRPPRSEISNRLFAFYDWCARADVPEVTTLAKTIEAWWPQILAFIDTGITNARTEATNRMVKDAARIAFGFRNLHNQRRRARLHCKRTIISQPVRG
jgi:transposase